jgi:uncharacterized protein YdbL (DUF1318 family)
MNPLLAARQSAQPTVQAFNPQQQGLQLQQATMNTPAIGQRMDGQPVQTREFDKYRHIEANKDRVYNAINAQRQRDAQFALEGQRQKNVLAAQVEGQKLALQTEEAKARMAAEQKEAMFALNDERFKGARQPIANVFADHNAWISGGAETLRQNTLRENVRKMAVSSIGEDIIKKAVDTGKTQFQPGAYPKFGTPAYDNLAINLLKSSPGGMQKIAEQEALINRQIAQISQSKALTYKSALEFATKTGISVPEGTASPTPYDGSPMVYGDPSNLPMIGDKPKVKEEVDPNTGFLVNPDGSAGSLIPTLDGTKEAIQSGLTAVKENAAPVGGVGTAGYFANQATKVGDEKAQGLVDATKNGDLMAVKEKGKTVVEVQQKKVANFKKLAKSTRSKVDLSDAEIIKMKPADLKKYVMENRQTVLGKYVGKIPGFDSKMLKKVAKVGMVGLAGMSVYDFLNAITAEDREALEAGNALAQEANIGTDAGETNGTAWQRAD